MASSGLTGEELQLVLQNISKLAALIADSKNMLLLSEVLLPDTHPVLQKTLQHAQSVRIKAQEKGEDNGESEWRKKLVDFCDEHGLHLADTKPTGVLRGSAWVDASGS
mmetsp:Transcript_143709/g.459885  ORF Transcript_143709/g.459885 Transcript_143709/m.459885 type:complete len:108 (+) Transcript_143709:583-906(+)